MGIVGVLEGVNGEVIEMNWLGALGGVGSLLGGISGLFGAGDAERAAEQAAEASITQFQQSAANQEKK